MTEEAIDLSHMNRGPRQRCGKCDGKGSYHEPPLEVQRKQKAEGKRRWIVKRVCDCIDGRIDCAPSR